MLLHALGMSARVWDDVRPLLEPHHEVIALTALGHRGGAKPVHRPARVGDMVDDAERSLDELGLERPHIAGNSIGGWMAIELARRGRARTACALSPYRCGLVAGSTSVGLIRRSPPRPLD